ncbi:MAG: rhomboid family intramembrane serine protease [Bacteroidales bacterium]|jgi:membrane associated rhomboid family serine protease|nr:rhomboid family intramembrane serine protease [Bacteroidales bacterium]
MYNEQYSPHKFNILPPVCKNLLIINVLMFFLTYVLSSKGIYLEDYLGLHFFKAESYHFWQVITYSFMHANFNHLFFNMFAVWMFGYTLENIWGQKRFIFFCLTSALFAALTQEITYYFMYKDIASGYYDYVQISGQRVPYMDFLNQINTIGASGIVFGLLLAFGMMFPNTYIYLYFLIPIKTKWFVIGYILLELINGTIGTSDGVAHFAHLGGALGALILILLWRKGKFRF